MFRTSLKNIFAHRLRLFATALAVMLGVAFMAGTLVLTDTVTSTFDNLFATVYKGTDGVVRAKAVFTGAQNTGEQRPRVDASVVSEVQKVRDVDAAEGMIMGYARLVAKDGTAMGNPESGLPAIGVNWPNTKELNPFTLVEGRPPAADDEIAIDKKSAQDGKLAVGDTTTVLVQGPPLKAKITGIVKFGSADSAGGASTALFTTAAAQKYVAEPGKFDAVWMTARPGVTQAELARSVGATLPSNLEAVTGATVTKEAQSDMRKGMSFFSTFMMIFAIVALFVGGFMIFNAFSITVAQRTRENGLLRALGATKRQVLASVILEAVAVGLLAAVLGIGVGIAVAAGLKALLAAMNFDIPAGGITLAARTPIVALIAGVGVTVLAALSPARKAGKVAPVAAMQDAVVTSSGYGSKERVFVGAGVLGVGVAALLVGLFVHMKSPLLVVGFGAALVFFGVATLGRTLSLPLCRLISAPLPKLRGITGTMARQNAMRNPKRTAATASALMVCVGLVGFITIFASSARASINTVVDRASTGDFFVSTGGGMMGGIDPTMAERIGRLPEVAAASGLRMGMAKIDGSVVQLGAVDPNTAFKIFDIKVLQGSPSDLGADAIALYKTTADDKHLKVGDRVPVLFKDTGTQNLRVAMIYGRNQPAGNYLLGTPAYEANFTNQYDQWVFVKKAPGASKATALAAVSGVAKAYAGTKVLDQSQFKAEMAKPINQLLGLVYVLLFLAVVIALLGIGNTLALSVYERTRELGLMRAVGMTRRQLRSGIRWESVIIALQGTALGLLVSVFFGWVLVRALSDQGFGTFSLPMVSLVVVVVLAAVAGVFAAVLPARRAGRLDVLRAIVTE